MKLTVDVAADLVEKARLVARNKGTTVQALLRRYLATLASEASGESIVAALERSWREADEHFRKHPRPLQHKLSRDELYEERLSRMTRKQP